MNLSLISLEVCVLILGLLVLVADLWLPVERKKLLGYAAAAGLTFLLIINLTGFGKCTEMGLAFNDMFTQDPLSIFFDRFFLLAAILVLLMIAEFSDRVAAGISEYYSITIFALLGMLFASSANNFALLFVSLELITVSFYVLTSFQRARVTSLEAGVKYLIIGALSTSFTVFGIALVWGTSGKFNFTDLAAIAGQMGGNKLFLFGLLFVMVGLGFKIAAFPFQVWAPDVYQGAPTPTTAFLACVIQGGPGDHVTMGERPHHHFRHHDSLRQSLRHAAVQCETIAGLLEHRACGLFAAGRCGIGGSAIN